MDSRDSLAFQLFKIAFFLKPVFTAAMQLQLNLTIMIFTAGKSNQRVVKFERVRKRH